MSCTELLKALRSTLESKENSTSTNYTRLISNRCIQTDTNTICSNERHGITSTSPSSSITVSAKELAISTVRCRSFTSYRCRSGRCLAKQVPGLCRRVSAYLLERDRRPARREECLSRSPSASERAARSRPPLCRSSRLSESRSRLSESRSRLSWSLSRLSESLSRLSGSLSRLSESLSLLSGSRSLLS